MPVNTPHPEYDMHHQQWIRCRDTAGGTDAIKDKAGTYLPSLTGQTSSEYGAYKDRALFYGATNRTIQGLLGAVFRKEFTHAYPFDEHIQLMTTEGLDLWELSRQTTKEVLTVGRFGILIDSAKDQRRAYTAPYIAENIINWRTQVIDGKVQLVLLVLQEEYDLAEEKDEFSSKKAKQYRVLRLGTNNNRLLYIQELYRQTDKNSTDYAPIQRIIPTRSGVPLDHIPFVFFNTHQSTPTVEKPPLLDLVDVNLSHYRTSADMEHGAHYTALPTAWIAGFPTDKPFKIGSSTAWVSDKVDAKAGFLEFKGQGLNALRELKKDKEHLMAILGARLLEDQRRAAEAADTYRIRQSGEGGALAAIVRTASDGMLRVLQEVAAWSSATPKQIEEIKFALNNDFIAEKMKPEELRQLMEAWQQGAISQDTFLYQLKQGEILPAGRSIEKERDMIDMEVGGNSGLENIVPMKKQFDNLREQGNKEK